MTFKFYTLGCKVNQYETQAMRELLLSNGFIASKDNEAPDVFIVNSCTVTAESDRKTRQTVRKFKNKFPNAIMVLTGCMPQAFKDDAVELNDADIIIGNTSHPSLPSKILEFNTTKERIIEVLPHEKNEKICELKISDFEERTRAFLKIQDGCERYCTYCTIPAARGFVRSKSIETIKQEVNSLAKKGFKEIVLVGINLSAFGKDTGFNLCDAVDAVCENEKIKRVRLGSLEPDHISDEMLSRFKRQEKFCPQFHLSLQSGSDATLKRMNRHYDSAFYSDLVKRIRKTFVGASVTTDIMVGFAGETEEEFKESLDFAKKIGFAKAHVFSYSRRKGTFAYNMPNQVPADVKARRSALMIEATNESKIQFLKDQIGTMQPVLFETCEKGFYVGHTPNYTCVKVSQAVDLGEIINVIITELADGDSVYGTIK